MHECTGLTGLNSLTGPAGPGWPCLANRGVEDLGAGVVHVDANMPLWPRLKGNVYHIGNCFYDEQPSEENYGRTGLVRTAFGGLLCRWRTWGFLVFWL